MRPDRFDASQAYRRPVPPGFSEQSKQGDLAAAAAVSVVLVQLTLAQLTLGVAICLLIIGRVTRWHPLWLTWPAAAGLVWTLSSGVRPAAAGYAAIGAELVRHLTAGGPVAGRLERLPALLESWRHWLSGQLPLALVAASAQALVVAWVWRVAHSGAAARPYCRPGLMILARRTYLERSLRRGEAATRDGACVGLTPRTGKRAAISWLEAQGGVLCTGQDAAAVTRTGLALAIAAIQHRKSVVFVDLASRGGSAGSLTSRITSACGEAGAPFREIRPAANRLLAAEPAGPDLLTGRGVVLHSLAGQPSATARLAVADLSRLLAEHPRLLGPLDCLIWIDGCEVLEHDQLANLALRGSAAGAAVVLSTTDGTAAADLARRVNVTLVRGCSPVALERSEAGVGEAADLLDAPEPDADSAGADSLNGGPVDNGARGARALLVRVRMPASRTAVARAAW